MIKAPAMSWTDRLFVIMYKFFAKPHSSPSPFISRIIECQGSSVALIRRTLSHSSNLVLSGLVLGYVIPDRFQNTGFESERSKVKFKSSSESTTSGLSRLYGQDRSM